MMRESSSIYLQCRLKIKIVQLWSYNTSTVLCVSKIFHTVLEYWSSIELVVVESSKTRVRVVVLLLYTPCVVDTTSYFPHRNREGSTGTILKRKVTVQYSNRQTASILSINFRSRAS